MAVPEIRRNDRVFICGQTGGGKSALAHFLFRSVPIPVTQQQAKEDPQWRLIIDIADSVVDPALTFVDPAKVPWDKSYSLRFVPDIRNLTEQVDVLLGSVRDHGNTWVWIDELGAVSTSHSTGPNLMWATMQARKFGVGVCSATPRPVGVNPAFYGQAQHLFSFIMTDPNDIGHVASSFGLPPSDFRRLLYSLPPFGYVWYNVRTLERLIMPPLDPDIIMLLEQNAE